VAACAPITAVVCKGTPCASEGLAAGTLFGRPALETMDLPSLRPTFAALKPTTALPSAMLPPISPVCAGCSPEFAKCCCPGKCTPEKCSPGESPGGNVGGSPGGSPGESPEGNLGGSPGGCSGSLRSDRIPECCCPGVSKETRGANKSSGADKNVADRILVRRRSPTTVLGAEALRAVWPLPSWSFPGCTLLGCPLLV